MIEQTYINQIYDSISLAEVAQEYGVTLTFKGNHAWAICPFHEEKTASFNINTENNLWFCFGCQKGGSVINFVMMKDGLTFPMAVRKLLKEKLNVELPDNFYQLTPEEDNLLKKKEAMRIINERLCLFFCQEIQKNTPDAIKAKSYVCGRWDREFCKERQIGYAPQDSNAVIEFAKKEGLSLDLMKELGLIKQVEANKKLYCVYQNRIIIPIKDGNSYIEGFTARAMDENSRCKYMNSANSALYCKSKSVFGLDFAKNKARKEEKIYLVEGAPDVIRLQSLGILNVVASLGGSWSEKQFELLKNHGLNECSICFIPDSDIPKEGERLGAGFKNVLRNGKTAMQCGFSVSVLEIPDDATDKIGKKMDPDEYFKKKGDLQKIKEKEFIVWFFEKKIALSNITEERQKVVKETCQLLNYIRNESVQERYFNILAKIDGTKSMWKKALNEEITRSQELRHSNNHDGETNMLREFGFSIKDGYYYGLDKNGAKVKWSNFTLKPLFHIKDDTRPVRLFEIQNADEIGEIIELDMETLTSTNKLRQKLLGRGNYIWYAKDDSLNQLNSYLAKNTETAIEIKQLGWQKQGFYSFCNGVLIDGVWQPADTMGIVKLNGSNFFLPAVSELFKDSHELYTNERKFRYLESSEIPIRDYFSKIVEVFRDNAKVGLCFYMATLFRDIIISYTRSFPLLNIFGPKGSGKSEFAQTLMSFFVIYNEPQNIETATLPALADSVASVSNALVHIDEFKNGIDVKKIEWLKDLWGGIGRSKINMDKDKKREQARVDSGIILTGQEIPTADIALFTRLVYLTSEKEHHTKEERDKFNQLRLFREKGGTHITQEILKYRKEFKSNFKDSLKKVREDVTTLLNEKEIIDRIESNWVVLLAAFLTLERFIACPFNYQELLDICVKGIINQNQACTKSDDVADFWNIISYAQQNRKIIKGQHFHIKIKDKLKTNSGEILFNPPRHVLMIRKNTMMAIYQTLGSEMKRKVLPPESITHYLHNTREFIGICTSPERFYLCNNWGLPVLRTETDGNITKKKREYEQDRPICFDYQAICDKYDINLDSYLGELAEDEQTKE